MVSIISSKIWKIWTVLQEQLKSQKLFHYDYFFFFKKKKER